MVTKKQQAKRDIINYWRDVAERAGRTFLQGYLAAWVLAGAGYTDLFTVSNVQYGAVAVAFSVAMSLGATKLGNKNSASVLTTE